MNIRLSNLLCAGAIAATIAFAGNASAQSADEVRAKCLKDAGADYVDSLHSEHQAGRKQRYITCMQQHGLQW